MTGQFLVDEHDINSVLGEGRYGKVYRATDLKTNRTVAAKKINMQRHPPKIRTRMEREIDILRRIPHHPNIVKFLHATTDDSGDIWIFMELCSLGNLDDYCLKNTIFIEDKFRIMLQIAGAILHVHTLDIIHRDVKPDNILVTLEDEQLVTKLSDFGVAKLGDVTRIFQTYAGTEVYMAPELFDVLEYIKDPNTKQTYSISVDIFSFALLILDFMDVDKHRIEPLTGKTQQLLYQHLYA